MGSPDDSGREPQLTRLPGALPSDGLRPGGAAEPPCEASSDRESLVESEARYRTLFDSIDEGFCVIEMVYDASGTPVDYRYVEVNPAFETQTGFRDAVGQTVRAFIPDHEPRWFEAYDRVLTTGKPTRFVDEATGLGRWFDVNAFPLGPGAGPRLAVLFTDVTARRRSEDEIRALNETLEARVAERTREVRSLAARLTVAEQAERQRIAHLLHDDLQQHLYGLSMVLALLGRSPSAERVGALAEQATTMLDGAIQMARTLATELSPAILQAERLADVLEWVADEQRRMHGLTVEVEVRADPRVDDPALRILLYQGLREVLFNVVKHSGGRHARLAAWADGGAGGTVTVVRVEDDGVGFDVDARAGQPAGFGLVGIRERLALIGGRFEIDSAPGRGTRVTLSVPSVALVPDSSLAAMP